MTSSLPPKPKSQLIHRVRHRIVFNLGVTQSRKIAIYEDLLDSVSLLDVNYWLQVLFSAGIATLGLVLDSPAVIIGAMLISPLMGPILANGMAFAVGDLILAARAIVCLNLSCIVAVLFAMFLIAVLPFKEQTSEITARIEPNLLDLVIALFSGALGAVATAKKPKGVVTSIPGVAIAVALMPPLCVVGFGIGRTISLRAFDGLSIAWGGGLLFVTNLTAITFMAMLVFQLIRIDVPSIKSRAEEWHQNDPESRWMRQFFKRLPGINRLEVVGSPRTRFLVILVPLLALMIPLGQSFGQLQSEFSLKQRQAKIDSIVKTLWIDDFAKDSNQEIRAYIDTLEFNENGKQLALQMRVFTSQPFTNAEESRFVQRLADRLKRDRSTINLRLVQIATSKGDLKDSLTPAEESSGGSSIQTVAELQSELWGQVDASLASLLILPRTYQLLNYGVILGSNQSLSIWLAYLGDRPLSEDAQETLTNQIRNRLALNDAHVEFNLISKQAGKVTFSNNEIELTPTAMTQLDQVANQMKRYPNLQITLNSIVIEAERKNDTENVSSDFPLVELRLKIIENYLDSFGTINPARVQLITEPEIIPTGQSAVLLSFEIKSPKLEQLETTPNLTDSPSVFDENADSN